MRMNHTGLFLLHMGSANTTLFEEMNTKLNRNVTPENQMQKGG
jgi:hypothetical protein